MADRRMFDRAIFKSNVMCILAEKNPKMELESQRIFEILILYADDNGRGRILPSAIKLEAFGATPNVFTKVTNEDIEKWIKQMEEAEAIKTYLIKGQKYYELTGWEYYQRGKWYKKLSNIPEPAKSQKKETPVIYRTDEPSEISIKLMKSLFPRELEHKRINTEARVLDELHEIDGYNWGEIEKILKWARTNWHWKDKFKSCNLLRREDVNGKTKFQTILESSRGEVKQTKVDDKFPETGEIKL